MLTKHGQFEKLMKFVETQADPEIYKWWGTYLESQSKIDSALTAYKKAQDPGSIVRLMIMKGDMAGALQQASESQNVNACFHLARALEAQNNIKEAIQYYAKAKRCHHAITLAMEEGMDNDVFNIANASGQRNLCTYAAKFLENRHKLEKAVLLYDKGGNAKKAMQIAMEHNMTDIMGQIGKEMTENIKDNDIDQSAKFFEGHGQFDKALELKIKKGLYEEAIDMAEKNNIELSEELAEKLIPPVGKDEHLKTNITI